MRFKILAIATFAVPLYLFVAPKVEASTALSGDAAATIASNPRHKLTAQNTSINQANWEKFSSSKGGFSVLMPGTPTEDIETDKTDEGETYEQHFFSLSQPEGEYLVAYSDFTEEEVRVVGADKILEAMSKELQASATQVLSQNTISLQGNPGRMLKYKDSDGSINHTQMFIVKGRLFLLTARASDANAKRFFDSFSLL